MIKKIGLLLLIFKALSLFSQHTVFICTDSECYTYHSHFDCSILKDCQGKVLFTEEEEAVLDMDRIPCCQCWDNATDKCKKDHTEIPLWVFEPLGNEAIFALTLFGSIFVLSNDVYLYPSYSFYRPDYRYRRNGFGFTFGLRKTFEHSALEYGFGVFPREFKDYRDSNKYQDNNDVGLHLNYIYLFKKRPYWLEKAPKSLNFYAGPSVNYVEHFGIGGIVGAQMKLSNRLTLDFRYELTTQTNQIQIGLIFKYQKKYLWDK